MKAYLPMTAGLATGARQTARGVGRRKGAPGGSNERNGHKKTVSESETVAGQPSEKITEMPKAKSGKPIVAKTFRLSRGSLLSRVPRFVNKFFG
jgi:hypothetical protein